MDIYGDIPPDILEAARKIQEWTTLNGWRDWCLFGIADRALVEKLRAILNEKKLYSYRPFCQDRSIMNSEEEGFDVVDKWTGRIVYTFDDRKDAETFIVNSGTGQKQYEVVGPGERNINRR